MSKQNITAAEAKYLVLAALDSGSYNSRQPIFYGGLILPNIREAVSEGDARACKALLLVVSAAAEAAKARGHKEAETDIGRCRIAYRALLTVTDAERANYHIAELRSQVSKALGRRYAVRH